MEVFTVNAWPNPFDAFHTKTYAAIDPSSPRLSTKGKHVVITGGGSGIGPAIAKSFATSGAASISLVGRTNKTLLETKIILSNEFPDTQFLTFVADIVDNAVLVSAFSTAAKTAGPIDILVANAGYMADLLPLAKSDGWQWNYSFEVNVKGSYNTIMAFLPVAAKNAAVVHVTTGINSLQFIPGQSAYHASKLAAAKTFDYLQHEHPEFRVFNIHPGVQKTAMDDKTQAVGMILPYDDIKLAANFVNWCCSLEAKPFRGKFLWCHWDVEELISRQKDIVGSTNLNIGQIGWPVLI